MRKPPVSPAVQCPSVHPKLLLRHSYAMHRPAVAQRRQQHHNEPGIYSASQEAHGFRGCPTATCFPSTAKAMTPRLLPDPAHFPRVVRPVQCAAALRAAPRPSLIRQVGVDLGQDRPERGTGTLIRQDDLSAGFGHGVNRRDQSRSGALWKTLRCNPPPNTAPKIGARM